MSLKAKRSSDKTKQLEQRIKELEEELKLREKLSAKPNISFNTAVLDLLSEGFFVYDFENKDFIGTPSLDNLLGEFVKSTPIQLTQLTGIIHPEDQPSFEDLFLDPRPNKKQVNQQIRIIPEHKELKESPVFLLKALFTSDNEGNPIFICALRNITKEVKSSQDLRRTLSRAEEADRIKTLFLLNISHNIRTPMNSILGFAELLSMTDPGPERRKEFIQVIKKQSKNLLQLIDDVAEIAKYETGQMTVTNAPVNLNLLLNELHRDIEGLRSATRRENVKLIIKTPNKEGINIFSDAGRIHQILYNLVNHSLKYTVEGNIELGYNLPTDGKISFFIKDNSTGISKEDLKYVLDKYIPKEKSDSGRYDDESGLNLSIARAIAKLLGGRINLDDLEDGGFQYTITIPFNRPPDAEPDYLPDEQGLNNQYKWNDRVILIVEDEEVNGLFLEAVFQETGAQTLYAKNGHQAVELAKSMLNKIDLILMDIKMPVMNGLKATQEIRKFNQSVPIIAQTALASEEDRQQCLISGCNDSVTKPIDIDELLHIVNRYFS